MRRWAIMLTAMAVLAGGCAAPDQALTGSGDPGAAAATVSGGMAGEVASRVLIDVRTPAEHAEGHLSGSQNIDVNAPDFRERIDALPRGEAYLVYCRSGNRSAQAAAIMAELGFTDVVNGGAYTDLAALDVQ